MSNIEKLARDLRGLILFTLSLALIVPLIEGWAGHIFGGDDTDSLIEHSHMTLRTDHGTGCQYLETLFGGITPRLGSDGHQICGPHR